MAWLVGDGFDFYNTFNDLNLNPALWQSVTFCTVNGGGRFGVGCWLQLGNNSATAGNAITVTFANSTTVYVNMAIISSQAHVNGGTVQCVGFSLKDGSAHQVGFWLRNGGDFVVTSGAIGSTVLGTASSVLLPVPGTFGHIQVKIVIHNTAGSVEMRFNGDANPTFLVTGINTRNGTSNFFCNAVHLNSNTAFADGCDDFYVFNDQGIQPNTWQGDVWATQQMPTSDVAVSWNRNAGSNNCTVVDEGRENGDTDYVFTNTVNAEDTYALTQLITTPANIVAVSLKYMPRMDDAGPHAVNASLISGATKDTLPNLVTSNSYVIQSRVYPADPNTNAIWSADAVNALRVNIKNLV